MLFHPEAQHLHQQHQHLRLKLKRYMMPHDTVISRLSKISCAIGKDVSDRDSSQRTPFTHAIAFGKGTAGEEIFDLLVGTDSIDLTARDEKQNTPLHYACGYGKILAVQKLLEMNSDITAKNGTGKTPLDLVKLEAKNPINEDRTAQAAWGLDGEMRTILL